MPFGNRFPGVKVVVFPGRDELVAGMEGDPFLLLIAYQNKCHVISNGIRNLEKEITRI